MPRAARRVAAEAGGLPAVVDEGAAEQVTVRGGHDTPPMPSSSASRAACQVRSASSAALAPRAAALAASAALEAAQVASVEFEADLASQAASMGFAAAQAAQAAAQAASSAASETAMVAASAAAQAAALVDGSSRVASSPYARAISTARRGRSSPGCAASYTGSARSAQSAANSTAVHASHGSLRSRRARSTTILLWCVMTLPLTSATQMVGPSHTSRSA